MRIAIIGAALGVIGDRLVNCVIEEFKSQPYPFSMEWNNQFPNLVGEEPVIHKVKPYRNPVVPKSLHRQSVNRGK